MKIFAAFVVSLILKCACANIAKRQMDLLAEIRNITGALDNITRQIESLKEQTKDEDYTIHYLEKGPNMCYCMWTDYINGLGSEMEYFIPDNRVFAGLFSWHDDWYQDREWKVYHCQVC